MPKKNHLILGCILVSTIITNVQAKEVFPKDLYTLDGCSETYYLKAKKTNRLMGVGVGAAAITASTIIPFGWVFMLGGMGAIAESGFDLGHQKFNEEFKNELKIKDIKEKKPIVLYPVARNYFDILNTLELAKSLQNNSTDIAEYIKIYLRSAALTGQLETEYKSCKAAAKMAGVSNSELKEVESKLMDYLMADEVPSSAHTLKLAKHKFAHCLIDLNVKNEEEEVYPIADMLLAAHELNKEGILNWKMKGVTRQYLYSYKTAKQENKTLDVEDYFQQISKLDQQGQLCKNAKKPATRKTIAKELTATIAK
jgi:hypothetical protein